MLAEAFISNAFPEAAQFLSDASDADDHLAPCNVIHAHLTKRVEHADDQKGMVNFSTRVKLAAALPWIGIATLEGWMYSQTI